MLKRAYIVYLVVLVLCAWVAIANGHPQRDTIMGFIVFLALPPLVLYFIVRWIWAGRKKKVDVDAKLE
jgi:hypothetical protein